MKYRVEFDLELRKNPFKGLYIALEGIDGSGKTTQVEKLTQYFKEQAKEVVKTREPRDDGLVGSLIRKILSEQIKVPSVALQYLFSADRAVHHEEVVIPSLKAGKVVISDRCFWSAIPYGILDRIMDKKNGIYDIASAEIILVAQSILSMYHQFTTPDKTFYLDVSTETGMQRLSKEGKTTEIYERKDKLEKIVSGYKWLVREFPTEITVINAEQPVEKVAQQIIAQA